jgi:hypothetical protein
MTHIAVQEAQDGKVVDWMEYRFGRRRPMPMLFAGRKPDDIARPGRYEYPEWLHVATSSRFVSAATTTRNHRRLEASIV